MRGSHVREVDTLSIDTTKIINNALKKIEEVLENNLTDPKSGSRPPTTSFIMTAYPEKIPYYPVVICFQVSGRADRLCGNADMLEYDLLFSVDVFAKSTKELDSICDDILNQMRVNWDDFRTFGMYALSMPITFRSNPMSDRGIHRKSAEYGFKIYVS